MSNQSLNFNLEFLSRIITVRYDGINWIWYNQYELYTNSFDNVTWARLKASDRLHKWDERQGGNSHPSSDTPNLFSGDFYHRPDYSQIKAFGMEVIDRWVQACKELGVSDQDCGTILTLRKDNEVVLKLPIRPAVR